MYVCILLIIFSVVPSAPVIKNMTVIDSTSVHVEWNIPKDANGVLTIYTISYSKENGSVISFTTPFNGQDVSYS